MADLDLDTRVEGGDGHYTATLSPDFVTPGGPFGGYVAALCLRAAGEHSKLRRPASFHCQYLNVAAIDQVDLRATTLRSSSRTEAVRVVMSQGEKPIVEALVWIVGELEGLDHSAGPAPTAPPPYLLRSFQELFTDFPEIGFHSCVEARPVWTYSLDGWMPDTPPPWNNMELRANATPQPPFTKGWVRMKGRSTFDDPFVDAARSLIVLDWVPIGAASMPHALKDKGVFFPSLDYAVAFHGAAPESEWLYCEAESPVSTGGIAHASGSVWSQDGVLVATGMQQMLQRVIPIPTS